MMKNSIGETFLAQSFDFGRYCTKGTVETVGKRKGPDKTKLIGPVIATKPDQPGRFIWQLVGVLET